jgi:hypothetical protein
VIVVYLSIQSPHSKEKFVLGEGMGNSAPDRLKRLTYSEIRRFPVFGIESSTLSLDSHLMFEVLI